MASINPDVIPQDDITTQRSNEAFSGALIEVMGYSSHEAANFCEQMTKPSESAVDTANSRNLTITQGSKTDNPYADVASDAREAEEFTDTSPRREPNNQHLDVPMEASNAEESEEFIETSVGAKKQGSGRTPPQMSTEAASDFNPPASGSDVTDRTQPAAPAKALADANPPASGRDVTGGRPPQTPTRVALDSSSSASGSDVTDRTQPAAPAKALADANPPASGRDVTGGRPPQTPTRVALDSSSSALGRDVTDGTQPSTPAKAFADANPPASGRDVTGGPPPQTPTRVALDSSSSALGRGVADGTQPSTPAKAFADANPPASGRDATGGAQTQAPTRVALDSSSSSSGRDVTAGISQQAPAKALVDANPPASGRDATGGAQIQVPTRVATETNSPASDRGASGSNAFKLSSSQLTDNQSPVQTSAANPVQPNLVAQLNQSDATSPNVQNTSQANSQNAFQNYSRLSDTNTSLSRDSNTTAPPQSLAANLFTNLIMSPMSSTTTDAVSKAGPDIPKSQFAQTEQGALIAKESQGTYVGLNNVASNQINNIGNANLAAQGAQSIKDTQAAPLPNSQAAIQQALQGMQQIVQGASGKAAEDTGKITGKAGLTGTPGMPGMADALTTTGKKGGAEGTALPPGHPAFIPGMPVIKPDKGTEGVEGGKLADGKGPLAPGQSIIVTSITGATATGATATSIQAGHTGTGIDPNAPHTGVPSGKSATGKDLDQTPEDWDNSLPKVEIIDSSEEAKAEEATVTRKEVAYGTDDEEDDDEQNTQVAVEGKRAQSHATGKFINRIRGLIEILIAEINGKKLDNNRAKELFNTLFSDDEREQYVIKAGDTLESIALLKLKDSRMIALILAVNGLSQALGKASLNDIGNKELQPGAILKMPTRSEILRYKIHALQDPTPLVVFANTLGAESAKAAAHAGKVSEYISYTCRIGDTLKSIARRHPALADESRWVEIAKLNNLSTKCDSRGESVARLPRGMQLKIPMPVEMITDEEESEMTDMRVITQSDLGENADVLQLRLEAQYKDAWMPVTEYDINPASSSLKIYDLNGQCKVIPIDLPNRAARELAENDLMVNAKRYCELFLTGKLAA